jgi:hypothetical protein
MYIVILGLENFIINSAINNDASVISLHSPNASMTKCKGPHHDLDDFTTYDFTTFTTVRLVIVLETHFCTVNPVSRSITSREVVKVVKS